VALRHPVELAAGHGDAGRLPGYISTPAVPNGGSNARGEGFAPRVGVGTEKAGFLSASVVTDCTAPHASAVNYSLAMRSEMIRRSTEVT